MTQTAAARNLAKAARYLLDNIRTNGPTPTRYYDTEEGRAAIAHLVNRGKARIVTMAREASGKLYVAGTGEECIEAIEIKPNAQTSTTTNKAPVVTMDTPVSVAIGSDQYAAKVIRVTDSTVVVKSGRDEMTFRPYQSKGTKQYSEQTKSFEYIRGWRANESYYLVIGESKTELDPSF